MKSFTQVSSETASHHNPAFQRRWTAALAFDRLLFCLAILLIFSLCSIIHAATLPQGFSELQIASGLANPVAMEFAPDGRLFVSEQTG
ncbi:MAG TPA: hypothetical protein VGO69_08995, partial [Pyrinomonadaceae bacterium]|nr:hypothetical protein [Pyrinomonadaceae bacterium]